MADRKDDQVPDPAGRATCTECGNPLAPDQRYCLNCGARRGRLPGAVASTLGALGAKGKGLAAAAGAKASKGKGGEGEDGSGGGRSWMPSPPAIAIAVIGMLALGVGLGSAMSEVASSAPISTLILEYPHRAETAAVEEPEEEVEEAPEEESIALGPEESVSPGTFEVPPPEQVIVPPTEEVIEPAGEEESNPLKEAIEATEREQEEREREEAEEAEAGLPEIKHVFLVVLGENGYESTYGTSAEAPYLSQVLPKKGELIPNYYGVTGGVLANEIALLSGQGPTVETAANCPNYTAIAPGTVAETAEGVEGNGCVYGKEVKSLPTELTEKEVSWRAYVEDMENGGTIGQPFRCRKPTLGGPDGTTSGPGDQYATWRNPVVYFSAITEGEECEKHDVGYELLTHDLQYKKATPALSLIFPNACHSGGEVECEPGAPKGAQGVAAELKTLVPAIMASPAYEEEGGLILITSAQAPQTGDDADPSGCCQAPAYPNLVAAGLAAAPPPSTPAGTTGTGTSTSGTSGTSTSTAEAEEEVTPTKYTEESVVESGGGGKVGLLMISPYVEAGKVEETEYANHFTLLKSLAMMLGVEPVGYATDEEMPALSPTLFRSAEEVEAEKAERAAKSKPEG